MPSDSWVLPGAIELCPRVLRVSIGCRRVCVGSLLEFEVDHDRSSRRPSTAQAPIDFLARVPTADFNGSRFPPHTVEPSKTKSEIHQHCIETRAREIRCGYSREKSMGACAWRAAGSTVVVTSNFEQRTDGIATATLDIADPWHKLDARRRTQSHSHVLSLVPTYVSLSQRRASGESDRPLGDRGPHRFPPAQKPKVAAASNRTLTLWNCEGKRLRRAKNMRVRHAPIPFSALRVNRA